MDAGTIHRINREALREAKAAERHVQHHMGVYLLAAISAVVAYFVLKSYHPGIVTSKDHQGVVQIDQLKLVLASVAVGLLVVICYHFLF